MGTPTAREAAAQERIHAVLVELAEIIGPGGDGQADWEPGDAPVGVPTLWEWVTVCCWVDDAGQDFVTVIPAAGMLTHHTVGLLRAALASGGYDAAGGEAA